MDKRHNKRSDTAPWQLMSHGGCRKEALRRGRATHGLYPHASGDRAAEGRRRGADAPRRLPSNPGKFNKFGKPE